MRRRRMRRARRNNERYGAATVLLLLLLVAAFVFAYRSLGIHDLLFKKAPADGTGLPSSVSTAPAGSATASPAPSGEKLSEEIKLNSVTLYTVQLGVFTKLENAEATAAKFRPEGSAGYLLKEDTLFRVIDSVYYNENDAKALRDSYRKGNSPDACIFKVETSGVNWNVNATREQIDAIRGALSALQSQVVALINAQKTVQQNQGTADDYKNAIVKAANEFTSASAKLTAAVGNTESTAIQNLNQCLVESAESLNTLAGTDLTDRLALLSGLKYNIIDILIKLQQKVMG